MFFAFILLLVIIYLIQCYRIIAKQEKLCKQSFELLKAYFIERYKPADTLTTYIASEVQSYQKPMTSDLKDLREADRIRSYETEHVENYLTDAIVEAIEEVEKKKRAPKSLVYEQALLEIEIAEKKIYYAVNDCNNRRRDYNEKLHEFPIIFFAKFYGYRDKEMLNIEFVFVGKERRLERKK